MGLAAFLFFVAPWLLVAFWLFHRPAALHLGVPAAPWRPLTDYAGPARDQRGETNPDNAPSPTGSGLAGSDKHSPIIEG